MADSNDNGLGTFFNITDRGGDGTDGTFSDLTTQTDLYAKGIKGKLPVNEFGSDSGKNYTALAKENGLGNLTDEHNVYNGTVKYTDAINKNGSDIIYVSGDQTANTDKAQTNDFTKDDLYLKRGR
jgi:hypothetical protein